MDLKDASRAAVATQKPSHGSEVKSQMNSGRGTVPHGSAARFEGSFFHDIEPFFYDRPMIYVDLGAHRGKVFRELLTTKMKVHRAYLVEPNPSSFAVLKQTVASSKAEAFTTCYQVAMGDAAGRVHMRDADSMSKVVLDPEAVARDVSDRLFEADIRTLDELAQSFTMPHVSILKVDVEGHEAEVLAGASRLLSDQSIDVIYIEAGMNPDGGQQTYYRIIEDILAGHGYRLFRIYEQTNEWLEDSPLLRRVNMAFMSSSFAMRHPFRLSRDLQDLRRDKEDLQQALMAEQAETRGRIEAFEAERAAAEAARNLAEELGRQLESTGAEHTREINALRAESAMLKQAADDLRVKQDRRLRETEIELGLLRNYGRDLEKRVSGILSSRTWRMMEPVRNISRRFTGRKAPQPFVSRLGAEGANFRDKAPQAAAGKAAGGVVRDLVAKLWGGFSGPAKGELARLERNTSAMTRDRVTAAWNLARWEAAAQDWHEAIKHLRVIARLDKKFFRSKRTRILMIEASIRIGDFEKAIHYAEHGLKVKKDGNFHCALANAFFAKGASTGTDAARLEQVNQMYRDAGLAPVTFADPGKGFTFGNFRAAPVARVEDGPLISVLVPVYNASAFLETAITSLLAQSWDNLEIIAVDDASSDDSWAKLERLSAGDPRLRIFRNDSNLGAYPTRNRALAEAKGEIITVHDSDDWSHPQMLEVQAKALLSNPELKITFSAMVRVRHDMTFTLRPERNNLEYVHRSYPSLMLRRDHLAALDRWDGISANADDELVQRARAAWGHEALKDILPDTPLSFFLRHDQSLTEQKGTHLKSLSFGIRREYAQQAAFWRNQLSSGELASGQPMVRSDRKTPFPIPTGLAPKTWRRDPVYDIVLISDLGLLGGTRRCNESYIEAASALGMRVGLFHWPRYDLRLTEIAPEYRKLSYRPNVDILVPEDVIECDTVLIHHPPILNYRIDAVPQITAERVGILVNQLPMQLRSKAPHYYFPDQVDALCQELFGHAPSWIPISPLSRRVLRDIGGYRLTDADWHPPLGYALPATRAPARTDIGAPRRLVLGRHSRDHWTKWPGTEAEIKAAYCAECDVDVRLMGGVKGPRKILGDIPSNWRSFEFDQIPVSDFLSELDFFLHFVHDDYIEEFGRNIMEAMAQGIPVILPAVFSETFGDAATYCTPAEVEATIRKLWADPDAYRAQVARGYAFVERTSGQAAVAERLGTLIQRRIPAEAPA
ncbi:MAG: FkbM family methyltransferase [Qingshengfaniella sp.]